jgi:predicted transcriptional regulator
VSLLTSKGGSKGIQGSAFILGVLLQKLDQGQHPQSIAIDLNKSKQLINYYIRQLEKKGYIHRKVRSNIAIYELLPLGKRALEGLVTGSVRGVLPRFHHLCFMYPILGKGGRIEAFLPLERGSKLRGDVVEVHGRFEYEGESFSVSRWHVGSSEQLKVWAPATYESSVGDALMLAAVKLDRVAQEISKRYDLALGKYRKIQRPEFAYERDPYAKYWMDLTGGANVKTEEGTIDQSEGPPEAEFFTTESAVAYLKMPGRVKDMERLAEKNVEAMQVFAKGMEEHMKLISQLQAVAQSLQANADEARRQRETGFLNYIKKRVHRG